MSKPFKGYPSITAYAEARKEQGASVQTIAKELGKPVSYVGSCLHMRKKNIADGLAKTKAGGIKLPHNVANKIAVKAKSLGMKPTTLARQVLENAFAFNMVDKIINSYSGSRF